jgi:hypothetical protein
VKVNKSPGVQTCARYTQDNPADMWLAGKRSLIVIKHARAGRKWHVVN